MHGMPVIGSRASGRSGGGGLRGGVPAFVGVDDVADEPVPDDVGAGQVREVDVLDVAEDLADDPQAALRTPGKVHLGDVTGDHDLRAETEPGEEHLHLFCGGILRFIKNDKRIIKSSSAHIR